MKDTIIRIKEHKLSDLVHDVMALCEDMYDEEDARSAYLNAKQIDRTLDKIKE